MGAVGKPFPIAPPFYKAVKIGLYYRRKFGE